MSAWSLAVKKGANPPMYFVFLVCHGPSYMTTDHNRNEKSRGDLD
jgi:hypothetical protein